MGALLRFGADFSGYTPRAILVGTVFDLSHLRAFEKSAVVSDIGWVRNRAAMFSYFAPMPILIFAAHHTDAALGQPAQEDK